jgi:hypothetical protein
LNKAQEDLLLFARTYKSKQAGLILLEVLPLLLIVVVATSALLICWQRSIKIMHYHNKIAQAYAWGEVYYWEGEPLFLETKQLTCQEKQLKVDNGTGLQEVELFKTMETTPFINVIHFKQNKKL